MSGQPSLSGLYGDMVTMFQGLWALSLVLLVSHFAIIQDKLIISPFTLMHIFAQLFMKSITKKKKAYIYPRDYSYVKQQ